MEKHGWDVEWQYLLDTAWVATFSHRNGGRVLGVNSEMDALPGVGHACGHNLIAIAGVAVALAIKAALIEHNIPGKVVYWGLQIYSIHFICRSGFFFKTTQPRKVVQARLSYLKGCIQGHGRMLDAS
jgi:hypothetical protein